MLQAELKILGGKHQGKLISLHTKKFLVGREQDCHLRPNSDLVSRHHCVFSVDEYSVRLRDLGSTNGTLVNGGPIRGEILLKSGDRVTIGKLELEVIIRQSSGKTPLPASKPLSNKSVPVLTTTEILTQAEDTDTSYDLTAMPSDAIPDGTPQEIPTVTEAIATLPPDTAIISTMPPAYPQPAMPGYPPNYPQMMPPGYPMPGAYMPPQYPQYPPAYGQPPGYGQPMGYPMGYPPMMPMQPSYPGVAVAPAAVAVEEPEVAESASAAGMPVRLPNPEETGAKPATPPAPAAAGAPAAKKEEKPSTTAADIIKQYMNRRG